MVKDLTRDLVHRHHHIFCDNFFTSVKSFHELHESGIYATGTMGADRKGFPEDLKECKERVEKERGEQYSSK